MTGGALIDLHCHTRERSYDGRVAAADVLRGAVAAGLNGVVFTDHNHLWSDEDLAQLRAGAGLPAGFFLASGQEVRTAHNGVTWGDLLVFGLRDDIPDGANPMEISERARAAGGFVLAPHPAVRGIGLCDHLGAFPVLAAEAWNGRYGEKVAKESEVLIRSVGLPEFGGSDTHRPEDIGGGATWFPRLPTDLADVGAMLQSGECRPWRPSMLERIRRSLMGSRGE